MIQYLFEVYGKEVIDQGRKT